MKHWRHWLRAINTCPLCALPGVTQHGLCDSCENALPWHFEDRQPKRWLGKQLPDAQLFTLVAYEDPVPWMIKQLKYQADLRMGNILSSLMAASYRSHHQQRLMPMPLHPRRFASRGFNQASVLAKALSREPNNTLCEQEVRRIRATQPQSQLTQAARQRNCQGAFRVNLAAHPDQRCVIIDDVITTGATVMSLMQALRANKHHNLIAWCFASA